MTFGRIFDDISNSWWVIFILKSDLNSAHQDASNGSWKTFRDILENHLFGLSIETEHHMIALVT